MRAVKSSEFWGGLMGSLYALGLSMSEVGRLIGVSRATVSRRLDGRQCPRRTITRRAQDVGRRIQRRIKVTEGGCWLWTGSCFPSGYGQLRVRHWSDLIGQYAHRVSYELHRGSVPEGMFVLHTCDKLYEPGDVTYRRCVNPGHLKIGTHDDNMRDMVDTGRVSSGDRHWTRRRRAMVQGASS